MNSQALVALGEKGMMERIEMARFPQALTSQEKIMLARIAVSYGFDPLMGELMVYQGRPLCTIDGRYRKAHETGELEGVESRPATKQERADWDIPEKDFFFRAEVWKKGHSRPFVGWGRVRAAETEPPRDSSKGGYRPLEVNPQRMAEKRAEAQALRKAFYLPLPSAEAPEEVPEQAPEFPSPSTPGEEAPDAEGPSPEAVESRGEVEVSGGKPRPENERPSEPQKKGQSEEIVRAGAARQGLEEEVEKLLVKRLGLLGGQFLQEHYGKRKRAEFSEEELREIRSRLQEFDGGPCETKL